MSVRSASISSMLLQLVTSVFLYFQGQLFVFVEGETIHNGKKKQIISIFYT